MCNFVPGECLALGKEGEFRESLPELDLPGDLAILPLIPEPAPGEPLPEDPFHPIGIAHVTNIPPGLEVAVASRLSAALHDQVLNGTAVVDLNYYLPPAALRPSALRLSSRSNQLSRPAQHWAKWTRHVAERTLSQATQPLRPIGLIDSGLDPRQLASGRSITVFDYSEGDDIRELRGNERVDPNGHGTAVSLILDRSLPGTVPLVCGRIGDLDEDVTVLRLARAYAHLASRTRPSVINLSLAPLEDTFICDHCGGEVRVQALHSQILPFVLRLAGNETFTVMAAGNSGQMCNARHASSDIPTLIFAVALDSSGHPAGYSSFPDSDPITDMAVCAFGGDGENIENGLGVFEGDPDSWGTSFAAPFITAAVYAEIAGEELEGDDINRKNILGYNHHRTAYGWHPDWFPRYYRRLPPW